MIDWDARIAELEEAERSAMAQFNYVSGRLEEIRALYVLSQDVEPPSLAIVEEVADEDIHA